MDILKELQLQILCIKKAPYRRWSRGFSIKILNLKQKGLGKTKKQKIVVFKLVGHLFVMPTEYRLKYLGLPFLF